MCGKRQREGKKERERERETNLFKTFLEMVGNGVVCGEEDGQVLRLLHGEGIHITAVQNTLSSVCIHVFVGHRLATKVL